MRTQSIFLLFLAAFTFYSCDRSADRRRGNDQTPVEVSLQAQNLSGKAIDLYLHVIKKGEEVGGTLVNGGAVDTIIGTAKQHYVAMVAYSLRDSSLTNYVDIAEGISSRKVKPGNVLNGYWIRPLEIRLESPRRRGERKTGGILWKVIKPEEFNAALQNAKKKAGKSWTDKLREVFE